MERKETGRRKGIKRGKVMLKPRLIIMIGNIVSGKTTWIKQNRMVERSYIVLSKDDMRRMLGAGKYLYDEKLESIIHESLISMLHHFMRENIDIILDETNMDKVTRSHYLFLTKHGYDYETVAVVIPNPSKQEIIERIRHRQNKIEWALTSEEVWKEVWERKNDKFEMPTKEEGFDEIWEIKNE